MSLYGRSTTFYAGHLVLDASGGAYLDDDVLKVRADRIVVDLRSSRYDAVGHVTVCAATCQDGVAFGDDLNTRRGSLVRLAPTPVRIDVVGTTWHQPAAIAKDPTGDEEPLALPDLEGEQPFAEAAGGAVAHLGADVRLKGAQVIVPGSRSVPLPSYVYTFSTSPGYVLTNLATGSEDVPWYVGSTRDSILGLHFYYNQVTKLGLGLDDHLVDGERAYLLTSFAPLLGPAKTLAVTWQEQINAHTSQTLRSSTFAGFGTANAYDVRDAIHRSYLELIAGQQPGAYGESLGWQSFDEPLARSGWASQLSFHLRTEYGFSHLTGSLPPLPAGVYHLAYEAYVATAPLDLTPSTTLNLAADARRLFDTQPHSQIAAIYTASVRHVWNRFLTTTLADSESSVIDDFPSPNPACVTPLAQLVPCGVASHFSVQTLNVLYNHGDALSFVLSGLHGSTRTTGPPLSVQPWAVFADVRFRVKPTLALELSRSYFFGFEGQRWGAWGIQLLP